MQRVCGVVGNDPLDEELNVEIVSKSKAATHIMHMQFTQTYIYYKVHYRNARARLRLRWSEIWGLFRCKKKTIIAKNDPRQWFQISFQLAVTSW